MNTPKNNKKHDKNTLILGTTNRKTVCPIVAVHVGIAGVEVQVAGIRPINRTTPIVAVATNIVERTIGSIAVARHRQ